MRASNSAIRVRAPGERNWIGSSIRGSPFGSSSPSSNSMSRRGRGLPSIPRTHSPAASATRPVVRQTEVQTPTEREGRETGGAVTIGSFSAARGASPRGLRRRAGGILIFCEDENENHPRQRTCALCRYNESRPATCVTDLVSGLEPASTAENRGDWLARLAQLRLLGLDPAADQIVDLLLEFLVHLFEALERLEVFLLLDQL